MRAMFKFMTGMWRLPMAVRGWLGLLMAVNMVAPLLFLDHVEARVVLATMVASFLLMLVLTARFGFTRILGLGHILWLPLLLYVGSRLGLHPSSDPVGIWLRLLILLNGVSLMIDAIDVLRYVRGDRAEMVEGLCPSGCRG